MNRHKDNTSLERTISPPNAYGENGGLTKRKYTKTKSRHSLKQVDVFIIIPSKNTTMPKPGSEEWWKKHADDKSAVLDFLSSKNEYDYMIWRRISSRLKEDDAVVFAAANNDKIDRLEGLSRRFLDDKKFVSIIVTNKELHTDEFRHVSRRLRNDTDVVVRSFQRSGMRLKWASDRLKSSKNVVMIAVGKNGGALQHASEKLRSDKDVVLKAVSNKPWSLRYATISARSDRDIILYATSNSPQVLRYASSTLKSDPDLVFEVASRDCRNRRSDLDFDQNHSCIFQHANPKLKSSRDFVLLAVKNFNALKYFPRFHNDAEVVKASFSLTPESVHWASPDLKLDPSVVLECLRCCTFDVILWSSKINNSLKPFAHRLVILVEGLHEEGDQILQPLVSVPMTKSERKRMKISNAPIHASEWTRRQWERIWIVPKLSRHPNWLGLTDIHKCISEFAGLHKTIKLSNEVKSCEPVIDRLIEMNCILDDIRLRKF